ncbi:ABC transporter substrate-binding protein [Shewanella olleyana]|uniref:ABC transporter substrate-binding protein n=1 Tax=Shewanella olleyana TaxID=135626 RepID=UPI00200CBEE5|nr:ABC transporter substrate-binding protein [Shewanella olleyana]MCL1065521.1 ABC transporter substrate-binding protein [Shewanella olleyana]
MKSKYLSVLKNTGSIKLAIIFAICITTSLLLLFFSASNPEPIDKPTIKIGVSQTPLTSPFIVAKHLSLFEQASLNVELVDCFGGVACSEALIDDQVDFATASESVVMFKSYQTHDIALLASFVQSTNDLKLLTLNKHLSFDNKSINNSELNHLGNTQHKVGIVKGSSSEYYFDTLQIAQGLDTANIEKVYLTPKELVDALINKHVDAISIWEPYGYQVNMLSNAPMTNLGIQGIYQLHFNLISKRSRLSQINTLEDRQVNKIIVVLEQSINWINENPDAAMNIVAKHLNVPLNQIKWSWDDYIFRLSISSTLLSSLQMQSHWAKQQGLVQGKEPNFREVIFSEPFEEAKSAMELSW